MRLFEMGLLSVLDGKAALFSCYIHTSPPKGIHAHKKGMLQGGFPDGREGGLQSVEKRVHICAAKVSFSS